MAPGERVIQGGPAQENKELRVPGNLQVAARHLIAGVLGQQRIPAGREAGELDPTQHVGNHPNPELWHFNDCLAERLSGLCIPDPAGLDEPLGQRGASSLPHRTEADTTQQLASFAGNLVEANRAADILSDASSGLIHETKMRAAHEQAALAGSLIETKGTREIPRDASSERVHEPEDVAGHHVTVVAGLLVQALRVLRGDRTGQ